MGKIETGVSGLYQIPYSLLNEMGFKNPDKVGVWGKGGECIPLTSQMHPKLSPIAT